MGVDVISYKKFILIEGRAEADEAIIVDDSLLAELPHALKGVEPGNYKASIYGPEVRFSPSIAFSMWCGQLAQIAGYAQKDALAGNAINQAFVELTGFPERHGFLGPAAVLKLHDDFVAFDAIAAVVGGEFYKLYRKFADAIAFARNGGCVEIS